ncbi:MAG: DUF4249 family protein [Ignavibacteriaceae bacterium]
MKGKIVYIIISALTLLTYSCNEQISANAPFRERYILNGIIKGDTTFQVVTLSHSYQPEGLDPLEYTNDPVIKNANVNVYYDFKVYHMRDTVIVRTDTSRYSDSLRFYYNDKLKPEPGKVIEIDAFLPNGLLLQSSTETPDLPSYGFFDSKSNNLVPPSFGTDIRIFWKDLGGVVYVPDLNINYYVKDDTLLHKTRLPLIDISKGGTVKEIFPTPSRNNFITLNLETIKRTLNKIPTGGRSKKDYSITNIMLDMIIYDKFLSNYYSSIKQGLDGFTVKLDSPDFSNIQGGFGIFGSYVKTNYKISFQPEFLESLGFR